MLEDFLYYVWQQQQFDRENLRTTAGEELVMLATGVRNADAGPDFSGARLRIGTVEWSGSVEMHVCATEWQRHGHQHDAAYNQVILHVVWEADTEVTRPDGTPIPTLALRGRVAGGLLMQYERLLRAETPLPCARQLLSVPDVHRVIMRERTLLERVEQKAARVTALHTSLHHDWEATAALALLAALGFRTNQDPMLRLGRSLPWPVVRRVRSQAPELEALLFGQAGLLPALQVGEDAYVTQLRRQWEFMRQKFELDPTTTLTRAEWKFGRMRPANLPTVRLAQAAALLHQQEHLFAEIQANATSLKRLRALFAGGTSAYWQTHYQFGKTAAFSTELGRGSIDLLIVNFVVPLLVAYAQYHGREGGVEEALALLGQLPAEHNHMLANYEELGWRARTAAEAQGLLGLWHTYCQPRQCLRCAIGATILKRGVAPAGR